MRLILIGPPGSGKGTQAQLLSQHHQLAQIGTGEILREAVRRNTPLGQKAAPYLKNGTLVPDDLVNELVAERFRRPDRPEHFVLDGYPRTLAQAASFDQVLRQEFLSLTAVLFLQVDDEEIVRRLSGRWICPNPTCQATYHATKNPPRQAGLCDRCGTPLVQREDDKEETIRRRLEVYHRNIAELIPHYRAQRLVREVPGEGDIQAIHLYILDLLKAGNTACFENTLTEPPS
jgi:adenylate kinase